MERVTTPQGGSGTRGSVYYPGCRKDAQCTCPICIASMQATLDLRPFKNLVNSFTNSSETPSKSLTRYATKEGKENECPGTEQSTYKPAPLAKKKTRKFALSNDFQSSSKSKITDVTNGEVSETRSKERDRNCKEEARNCKKTKQLLRKTICVILGILFLDFIVSHYIHCMFQPIFSLERVRLLVSESLPRRRLADRLDFIARKMAKAAAPKTVVNCTGSDSDWRLEQEGLMVRSRCLLYTSIPEEVSVWGFPAQTAGVIGRGFSDRSFTVISGQVIEWYEGRADGTIHMEGDSWTHEKFTASLVQMDGKTWVIEYRRSAPFQGDSLLLQSLMFLQWFITRAFEEIKSSFASILLPKNINFDGYDNFHTPT